MKRMSTEGAIASSVHQVKSAPALTSQNASLLPRLFTMATGFVGPGNSDYRRAEQARADALAGGGIGGIVGAGNSDWLRVMGGPSGGGLSGAYGESLRGRSTAAPPTTTMPAGYDRTQGPGGPNSLPAWATSQDVRDGAAAAVPNTPGSGGGGGMPGGRSFFDLIADIAGGGGGMSPGNPMDSEAGQILMGLLRGPGDTSALEGFLSAGRAASNRTAGANASTAMQRALGSGAPSSAAAGLANQAVGDTMSAFDQLAAQTMLSATQQNADRRMRGLELAMDTPLRADALRMQGAGNRIAAANLGLSEANSGFDQALRSADFQRDLNRDLLGYGDTMTGNDQASIDAQMQEQDRQWGVFLDILGQISGLSGGAPTQSGGGGNPGLGVGQLLQALGLTGSALGGADFSDPFGYSGAGR